MVFQILTGIDSRFQDSRLFNSTKERIYYKENLRKYMEIKYYKFKS